MSALNRILAKILFVVLFGTTGWANGGAYPVRHWQYQWVLTPDGRTSERFSFIVYDRGAQNSYYVKIETMGNAWVGSEVYEMRYQGISDTGSFRPMPVPIEDRQRATEITRSIGQHLDSYRSQRPEGTYALPEPNRSSQNQNRPQPRPNNTQAPAAPVETRIYRENNTSGMFQFYYNNGPSAQHYNREQYRANMERALANRMDRMRYDGNQHRAQQEMVRAAQQAQRNAVAQNLEANLQGAQNLTALQRSEMLYLLYLASLERQATPQESIAANSPPPVGGTKGIGLTPEGADAYAKEMQEAIARGDWARASELNTLLNNPWSGQAADARTQSHIDEQGLLKGAAFKANGIPLRDLATRNPSLAFDLARSANDLQAFVNQQPYMQRIPRHRIAIESTALMMRLAAASGDPSYVRASQRMVVYFTGQSADNTLGVTEANGVIRFDGSGNYREVMSQANGSDRVAKAVYNELMENLSWVSSRGEVDRGSGPVIPVAAALQGRAAEIVNDPQGWISRATQTYPLPNAPHLSLASPEANVVLGEMRATQYSVLPQGKEASRFAYQALQFADEAYRSGNSTSSQEWVQTARMLADVTLGFVPVVGTALDVYSFATGYNLITGERLSTTDRLIAGVGIVTLGVGSRIIKSVDAIKTISRMDGFPRVLNRTIHNLENLDTNDVNRTLARLGYTDAPYRPGARAYRFELPEASTNDFVRVFTEGTTRPESIFILERRLVEGKNPQQIANLLALPTGRVPTHIADVHLPETTRLIKGPTHPAVREGNRNVGYQYHIEMDNGLSPPTDWFQNRRRLPDGSPTSSN